VTIAPRVRINIKSKKSNSRTTHQRRGNKVDFELGFGMIKTQRTTLFFSRNALISTVAGAPRQRASELAPPGGGTPLS
jgi:hypothetical protein